MSVVMIVSDTVRMDYLGSTGGWVRTPNLDALAKSSIFFRNYQAASFPTVPARADYLTGTYALAGIGWGPLPRSVVTVPELLDQAGITTVGVVDTPFFLPRGFNYDRGFQYFYDLPTQDLAGQRHGDSRIPKRGVLVPRPRLTEFDYPSPATMTLAEQCLEQLRNQRFFLYVDTWDPHEPWDPPEWYVKEYMPDYDGRVVDPCYGPYDRAGLSIDDVNTARACYAGKLTMVDRWIGRLLERIDSLQLTSSTAVIFVSDHGMYFGDRNNVLGKMTRLGGVENRWLRSPLYRELTNVPLMIRLPRGDGHCDWRLASAVDIAPTVLDLMEVAAPPQFVGRSLVPLVHDEDLPGRSLAITAMPLASPGERVALVDDVTRGVEEWQPITVHCGRWTLLFAHPTQPIELYDTETDPAQSTNVADQHPEVVTDLHAALINELTRAGAAEDAIAVRRG